MDTDAMGILTEAGLDTQGALGRLMNNPSFYLRMLGKFQQDATFGKLRSAVEAGDAQAAGEAAHALKGVAATLGMTELSALCADLQMLYQGRESGDPAPIYAQTERIYAKMSEAVTRALGA